MRNVKSTAKSGVMKFKSCLMALFLCAGMIPGAQARYYDPELARFVLADPIVPSHINPQTFNRYSYVNNNPIVFSDPDGHVGFLAPLIAFAVTHPVGGA